MRLRRPSGQTLAAVGALTVLAAIAIATQRDRTPAADSYASTDYRSGGLRAWSELLTREGISTGRFVLRPIELDRRIDTLISAQPAPALRDPAARTAADTSALAAWVRAGGRLVYIGRNTAVGPAEKQQLDLPFLLPDVGSRGSLAGAGSSGVRTLAGLGTDRMLLVEHAGTAELSDGNGDIVVRYSLGRGEVIAVTDAVPFTNAHIAAADNARLAYELGRPRRAGGLVAFDDGLHGALIDRPWYRALPMPVRVTLGIAGVALLLGLIGSALAGGPPLRLAPEREPTSKEFVDALAALHARIGARAAARTVLVRAALAAAARSAGLAADLAPEVLAQRLGTGARGGDVRRLLGVLDGPVPDDAALLASAQLAYLVRKESRYDPNGDGRRAAFAGGTRTHRRR